LVFIFFRFVGTSKERTGLPLPIYRAPNTQPDHSQGLETGAAVFSVSWITITRANFQQPSGCCRITRMTFLWPISVLPFVSDLYEK
jgi:hypothetical protein